jgi:hypothetical protein
MVTSHKQSQQQDRPQLRAVVQQEYRPVTWRDHMEDRFDERHEQDFAGRRPRCLSWEIDP